ncbi:MAG TPA: rod shape-determining protein RodA, partial [Gammaproteobacteria bacterium]|nr:rod shape-determining protein RodA [Gammaproteobacteria bacterium]
HLDLPLMLSLILLSAVGLFILYSASGEDVQALYRQATRIGLGLTVMFFMAQISPQTWKRWSLRLYVIGIVLLVAVVLFGDTSKGAQRWLDLGLFKFQPSELMKLALPMAVAWFLSEKPLPPRLGNLLVCVVIIVVPVLLVAKQPDLGTSLLIASSGLFALYFAGLNLRVLLTSLAGLGVMAYPIWEYVLHDYQKARVMTFLNPENDPLGRGYHIIQSKIAVGSGGVYGKGWLNGTQSQLDFLPERNTDFIFAVFTEEFGFIGALLLFGLYLFVILRGLYIAVQAQDTYSRLLAGSLSLTFFVYVFVNTGMVIGLLPVVGVPLPLISYGGTSIVTLMASFGLLMSIHTHRKLLSP